MKGRINWIDISKGIAILLVIIGHMNVKWFPSLERVIDEVYTFHMPLFFILSGLTFKYKKDGNNFEFIRKKFKALMLPYICFSFLIFIKPIAKCLLQVINKAHIDFNLIFETIFDVFVMGNGFWFLMSLFFAEILLYFILKLLKNKKGYIIFSLCVLYIISFVYYKFLDVSLPFRLQRCLLSTFFVGFGYLISSYLKTGRHQKIERKKNYLIYAFLCIAINFISNIITLKIYGETCTYDRMYNAILYLISTISGSFAIIYISKFINKNKIFMFLGQNSLIIYIFNDIVLKVYKFLLFKIFALDTASMSLVYQYILAIIILFLSVISMIPIVKICNNYLYKMLGKNKQKPLRLRN